MFHKYAQFELERRWLLDTLPAFALREVTEDPRFTGGALVQLTAEQCQQLLTV